MPEQKSSHLDAAIEGVSPSRRAFLRNLLVAGAAAGALAVPASELLAESGNGGCQKGGGKGKGKGGKGKGKGNGNN